jgi:hypothetical protein
MIRRAVVFAILAFLVAAAVLGTSRLVDLRYVNVPMLHPYPPSGYEQNPFNPSDRGDLIPSAQAARVKSDLLEDGKIEVAAAATGDGAKLDGAETGRALTSILGILDSNARAGVVEKAETKLQSVSSGRLADPNDATITWCVEERGMASVTYLRRDTGAVSRSVSYPFLARYWLVLQHGRYVIADSLVQQT